MTHQSPQTATTGDSVPPASAQLLGSQSVGHLDCPIGTWLFTHPTWNVPVLTGAFVRLAVTSWQQAPSGSLPDDCVALTAWSGLSAEDFARHQALLLSGWTRNAGRLWFAPLVERADSLISEHGDTVDKMRINGGSLSLAPEDFTLAGTSQERSDAKTRKTKLPKDFRIDSRLARWGFSFFKTHLQSQGAARPVDEPTMLIVLNQIFEQFVIYVGANGKRYDDWYLGFMQFTHRQTNGSFGFTLASYFPAAFDQPRGMPMPSVPNLQIVRPATGSRRDRVVAGGNEALAGAIAMLDGAVMAASFDDAVTFDMNEEIRPAA